MTSTTTQRIGAAVILALTAVTASGCTAVSDALHHQKTHTYATADEFSAESPVPAAWVPADASVITLRTAADEETGVAALLVSSESALPESCTEAERKSSPMLNIDGEPDVYSAKAGSAHICGDWTVMPSEDGWFGWTPNVEDRPE